jgi:hypothetical protein
MTFRASQPQLPHDFMRPGSRQGRLQGASASDACGAENIFGALCPTPGNSTSRQLNAQPRSCASVHAALVARGALGTRVGTVIAIVDARVCFAEIDGERQFEIAPQLGLAIGAGIDLTQPIGRCNVQAGKHIAARVGDDDAFRLRRDEGGEALQKLAAGRMSEQGIGERPALLLASPIDQR